MNVIHHDFRRVHQESTQLRLYGNPVLSVRFDNSISVNTFHNFHKWKRGQVNAEWRLEAREAAYEHTLFLPPGQYLVDRALVIVDVYIPPSEEIADIHNKYIKPMLDGFSDAEVWADDEWAFVPIVMYNWAGIESVPKGERTKRYIVIKVYELGSFVINGDQVKLPKGRTRL